jgi:hypothetical protein
MRLSVVAALAIPGRHAIVGNGTPRHSALTLPTLGTWLSRWRALVSGFITRWSRLDVQRLESAGSGAVPGMNDSPTMSRTVRVRRTAPHPTGVCQPDHSPSQPSSLPTRGEHGSATKA